jgi:hypothetical protein
MTEGIHHITGDEIDPWGYATMNEQQLLKAAKELAKKLSSN